MGQYCNAARKVAPLVKKYVSGDVKVCGHLKSNITKEISDKGFEFGGLGNSFEVLVEILVVE